MSGYYVILDNDLNLTYCYIMWTNVNNYSFDRIYKSWHWTFEHLYLTFPNVMLQLQLLKVLYYSYVPVFVFLPEHWWSVITWWVVWNTAEKMAYLTKTWVSKRAGVRSTWMRYQCTPVHHTSYPPVQPWSLIAKQWGRASHFYVPDRHQAYNLLCWGCILFLHNVGPLKYSCN